MIMQFEVYAKQMYCGTLTVFPSGSHYHCNRDGEIQPNTSKLYGYTGLRLVRL
jgi:hypothetical protein